MFSVIIPLYNKAQYIQRAIDSALNQSFSDFEIIVVDDGSTDGGGKFVTSHYGSQIKILHQSNQGVSEARNRAIQESKNPYLAFLDADDYWHSDYLNFVSKVIQENPEIGIIGCHYDPIELEKEPKLSYFRLENYFKDAIYNTRFFTSATCVKREFFILKPGFDPLLNLGEDIDIWLRASLFYGDGIYIQNTLVYYSREDVNSATGKSYLLDRTVIPKVLNKNFFNDAIKDSSCTQEIFVKFQSKWGYLNLYPHYQLTSNHSKIQELVSPLSKKYFLIHFIYQLPSRWLKTAFSNGSISGLFRNYMKFCFRYIYR